MIASMKGNSLGPGLNIIYQFPIFSCGPKILKICKKVYALIRVVWENIHILYLVLKFRCVIFGDFREEIATSTCYILKSNAFYYVSLGTLYAFSS